MAEPLKVDLGDRSYWLHFGSDLSGELSQLVRKRREQGDKVAVLTVESVGRAQGAWIDQVAAKVPRFTAPDGETAKNLEMLGEILAFLAAEKLDRRSLLIVIGGGVIGDLGGFAAAVYLRGIDFVQVPTTLLAMVDSSVGGKTGVNLAAGKNLVGAFHQPRAVFISTNLLRTLPAREFAAGLAEVIKYGLLGDADLFAQLEKDPLKPDHPRLGEVIRRCCAVKAAIVEADEFERAATGGRPLLNLGHTFGHALEQVAGYGTYLHGEAVAIGLVAAARLSQALGRLPETEVNRIKQVVAAHGLPTTVQAPLSRQELDGAMARDKKVRSGKLRFVILEAIGSAVVSEAVPAEAVTTAWAEVGIR